MSGLGLRDLGRLGFMDGLWHKKLQNACCAMPDLKVGQWKEHVEFRGLRNLNDRTKFKVTCELCTYRGWEGLSCRGLHSILKPSVGPKLEVFLRGHMCRIIICALD